MVSGMIFVGFKTLKNKINIKNQTPKKTIQKPALFQKATVSTNYENTNKLVQRNRVF
jgi:hypothetical protein